MRSILKNGTNLKRSAAILLGAAVVVGCGSSKPVATVVPGPTAVIGLPTPAAAGPVNTYTGAQSPGQWSLTLDNTSTTFSYQPVTYPAAATRGNLQVGGGFSSLGTGGLALEVLGQAAVLRPGTSASTRVFAVPQTSCYAVTGKIRFQYIDLFPGTLVNVLTNSPGGFDPLGYGSVVASTDSAGKTWQFENLQGNYLLTTPASLTFGPATFTGTCAASGRQASIAFASSTLLANQWGPGQYGGSYVSPPSPTDPTTQSYVWVGPTGFFAADQSIPGQFEIGASVAGMIEPASALSTSALAAAQYVGFAYQAPTAISGYTAAAASTAPVGFGQVVAGSGSTLTGGIFPNDAVTGTPNSDTQINLGAENATYNGLYTSVKITVLDPSQNCANFNAFTLTGVASGVNTAGYITCTFPGVAVAGNPGGNYAIFLSTYNWAATLGGVPEEFFLFQQQ